MTTNEQRDTRCLRQGCNHPKAGHGGTFPKAMSGKGKCCLCSCPEYIAPFDDKEPVASKDVRA